ncbi:DUF2459 domain-containing protein [Roseococcus sp. SDR]|uniref:DUF2459 domain-containing protein n=1 Tax=Roseococcus sp. SDR TaxID=2835532 RepID=UPI001BCC3E6E|nr:DUF2459 domain-containing protein [Roseococcus sp. SDR]MBS7792254.1 DUF2459 domain-containing protein [Roseococcus sp. SDR]MBV1847568.1 DUF2459 domain-containing protein [Roseococcus sp. SDR]
MRSWTASPEATRRGLLLAALALPACATLPEPPGCTAAPGPAVWLLDAGWHTEIGLPPAWLPPEITTPFPGAALLFLGFGKRDFMLAERPGLAEWLAGPIPGAAALQLTAWPGPPRQAWRLPITPGGLAALSSALASSFAPGPELIEARPGRRFYAAARGYSLAYTCNSWTAEMLAAAGLPIATEGVVLSRGVMTQAARLPGACRLVNRA